MVAILYIACALMLVGQMYGNDQVYFSFSYAFDTVALIYFAYTNKGLHKEIFVFLSILAAYNIVKYNFEDVTKDNLWEYANFYAGLLIVAFRRRKEIANYAKRIITKHRA